jgi:hypothetical protein
MTGRSTAVSAKASRPIPLGGGSGSFGFRQSGLDPFRIRQERIQEPSPEHRGGTAADEVEGDIRCRVGRLHRDHREQAERDQDEHRHGRAAPAPLQGEGEEQHESQNDREQGRHVDEKRAHGRGRTRGQR